MTEIKGSCGCGTVRFALTAPPKMMATCHCSRCRKFGASTFVMVDAKTFRWEAGQDAVATLEAKTPYKYNRNFCGVCGTALGEVLSEGEMFPVAANCLDADPGVRTAFHEFVGEKPAWYDVCDDAKQFEGHPEL
ncbi:MAG: GFA family protein [Pseudomonadota bacterium]